MSSPPNISTPRSDTTPEQTRDARARAWAYVFECFYRRVGKVHTPDDQEQFVTKERRTNDLTNDVATSFVRTRKCKASQGRIEHEYVDS